MVPANYTVCEYEPSFWVLLLVSCTHNVNQLLHALILSIATSMVFSVTMTTTQLFKLSLHVMLKLVAIDANIGCYNYM